jgi:hypothetical protein
MSAAPPWPQLDAWLLQNIIMRVHRVLKATLVYLEIICKSQRIPEKGKGNPNLTRLPSPIKSNGTISKTQVENRTNSGTGTSAYGINRIDEQRQPADWCIRSVGGSEGGTEGGISV